jgi:dihydrofolate reductase
MARIVFGMNVSLDGYVDHTGFGGPPGPVLFRHFVEHIRELDGMMYGRGIYDVLRYWDEDQSDWGADEREYAKAWRSKPKWVASRTLKSVGPNATLFSDGVAALRELKAKHGGEIEVAGPKLAHSVSELIDEYRLYLRPVVLGSGNPFFAGPRPKLRLIGNDEISEDAVRLTYVPA